MACKLGNWSFGTSILIQIRIYSYDDYGPLESDNFDFQLFFFKVRNVHFFLFVRVYIIFVMIFKRAPWFSQNIQSDHESTLFCIEIAPNE